MNECIILPLTRVGRSRCKNLLSKDFILQSLKRWFVCICYMAVSIRGRGACASQHQPCCGALEQVPSSVSSQGERHCGWKKSVCCQHFPLRCPIYNPFSCCSPNWFSQRVPLKARFYGNTNHIERFSFWSDVCHGAWQPDPEAEVSDLVWCVQLVLALRFKSENNAANLSALLTADCLRIG